MGNDAGTARTIRQGDPSLRAYLEDIRKADPLDGPAEGALFRLFRKGNAKARERLIASNMRFVVKVALEFRSCPMPIGDLISEGSIGLIHAVETFDSGRGVKFISYAVWWIRSHITKALNDKGYLIRLPANQYFRLRKALQAEKSGRLEDEDLRVIRQLSRGCASLNAAAPGTGIPWSDLLPDRSAPDPSLDADISLGDGLIDRMLENLPDRERKVVQGLFGVGNMGSATLKEVGRSLDLSSERVRQIRKLALDRIRRDPDSGPLRDRYECLLLENGA